MSLPSFSIRKPVTILMGTLIVLLFGIVSLIKLPVELYPNTSFGQISIIIQARGGIPPTEVESLVTKPIEEAVATVGNLESLLSISKEGESTVVLSFLPGTDMDFAALEVREKFARIKNKLPKEIEKPVIAQFQQGDVPIFVVAATSEQRTTEDIRKVVDNSIKEEFKRVAGVANVEVVGGRERKILVEADQVRLAAYGIPLDELTSVIGGNNLNLLSGEVKRQKDRFLVRMIGEFGSVEEIGNLGLRVGENGSMIRVKDVAVVKDSYLDPQEHARMNVKPVVNLYVQKESTKNTITVAKDLLSTVEALKTKLPQDIHLIVTSNQADFIKKAIDNLKESLLQGVVLIILVFFVFLFRLSKWALLGIALLTLLTLLNKGLALYLIFLLLVALVLLLPKYRLILIVTLPIPVSVVGTFIFMRQHGLTVNVMTLFGIALGVGLLVDNAIVVFENILKKREAGQGSIPAALQGSQEMFLTIVASTLSTTIVFLPLVFMGQDIQLRYSSMAWTIVVSLLVSVVSALTLVPTLCARPSIFVYEGKESSKQSQSEEAWVKKFSKHERHYLFKSIRFRPWVLLGCVAVLAVSFFLFSRLGSEYLGAVEQDKFTAFIEMPTGTKLEISNEMVKKVEEIAEAIPEVKNVSSRVEPWSSKVYVELKDRQERKRLTKDIIESMRQETSKLGKAFIYFQEEEQVGSKEVVLEVFGYDYAKLRELAIAMSNRLGSVKGLTDVKIRMREGRPEMQIAVNKKKAGLLGLTVGDTANQVHAQMRGLRATVFHTEGKEVETISRLDEKYRKTFKDLHKLIMTNDQGSPVFLDQIAQFKFGLGPSEIWRKDKNRMVQVSANIGKMPLSEVVKKVEKSLKGMPFPEDYFYRIGGDYPMMMRTNKQMGLMFLFVLALVYLVLASLFESFYQPFIIMIAVPLALIGAALTLTFGPKVISIGARLGMMMLSGIVVNHSIMLLDRINYYRKMGLIPIRAAILANRDRLRPILMTTLTTILGLVPMAIDKSEGANLWSPLALTVIGGIVSSTFLTLMVTPAIYIVSQDIRFWIKHKNPFFLLQIIRRQFLTNK